MTSRELWIRVLSGSRNLHRVSGDLSENSFSFFADQALVLQSESKGPAFRISRKESTMQRTLIFALAVLAVGFSTAHAQSGLGLSGQTSVTSSTIGAASDPLSVPTSTLPASKGAASGGGSTGATNGSAASTDPEIPVQLSGEASNTSTQAANTTTSASGSPAGTATGAASSSTSCGPQVPSTDGGSVNLTEIAGGLSLNGC
jgi:hypothetical protein